MVNLQKIKNAKNFCAESKVASDSGRIRRATWRIGRLKESLNKSSLPSFPS